MDERKDETILTVPCLHQTENLPFSNFIFYYLKQSLQLLFKFRIYIYLFIFQSLISILKSYEIITLGIIYQKINLIKFHKSEYREEQQYWAFFFFFFFPISFAIIV